jgi:hypothetical protein
VIDLRNIYRPDDMAARGFAYVSVGHRSTLKEFHDHLITLHCDGTWENLYSQPIAALWLLFWTPTFIVFLLAAWAAWRSSREFRHPTGRALKVRTRMFCPNYSHTAGLIRRLNRCQTVGCPAPIAIHPILYVMAKAAAVHLTPTVILPSRRC